MSESDRATVGFDHVQDVPDAAVEPAEPSASSVQTVDDSPGSNVDLDRIDALPLDQQPAAYRHIHDQLQRALAEIDEA